MHSIDLHIYLAAVAVCISFQKVSESTPSPPQGSRVNLLRVPSFSRSCGAYTNQGSHTILTANEIDFSFEGENTAGTDDKKCAKQFKGKPTEKPTRQKPVPSHKAREKGAQWHAEKQLNQGEKNFRPTHLPSGSKKGYPLLFSKYEIHKGQHLYKTHKKAGICQCTRTCRLKKIQSI